MLDSHYDKRIACTIDKQLKLPFIGDFFVSRFIQLEQARFEQLVQSGVPEVKAAVEICYCLLSHHAEAITHYNGAIGAALHYLYAISVEHVHTELGTQAMDLLGGIYAENQTELAEPA